MAHKYIFYIPPELILKYLSNLQGGGGEEKVLTGSSRWELSFGCLLLNPAGLALVSSWGNISIETSILPLSSSSRLGCQGLWDFQNSLSDWLACSSIIISIHISSFSDRLKLVGVHRVLYSMGFWFVSCHSRLNHILSKPMIVSPIRSSELNDHNQRRGIFNSELPGITQLNSNHR
ncbi:hypothetical protein M0812_03143 [Anaeramoeba flamelloides]|uniref:Uncharacterized protein n=1 Tax=Anaeramoeba flamelloides TaxID=1746091 RepID=A0AAV7YP18_9EUKA|nr:hypothetical protein M0812_03143 [Anaeramoeba flamelloides]